MPSSCCPIASCVTASCPTLTLATSHLPQIPSPLTITVTCYPSCCRSHALVQSLSSCCRLNCHPCSLRGRGQRTVAPLGPVTRKRQAIVLHAAPLMGVGHVWRVLGRKADPFVRVAESRRASVRRPKTLSTRRANQARTETLKLRSLVLRANPRTRKVLSLSPHEASSAFPPVLGGQAPHVPQLYNAM